ncbi:hypothetical protein F5Y19DRAFT_267054 [Xylariaceae sp. FL1651]|nr:hypothetical protein F5Y19DRAFT_267054 [Xylariaceae sp. FL1651]
MIHLRLHRRAPSNPTSPIADRASWDTTALQPAQLVPEDGVPAPDIRPRSSTSVPFAQGHGQLSPQPQRDQQPPVLPPISRVVSADSARSIDFQSTDQQARDDEKPRDDTKPLPRSPYNEQSGFIGGLAYENYRREQAALNQSVPQRGTAKANAPIVLGSSSNVPLSALSSKPPAPAKPMKVVSSFVSPIDFQNVPAAGKRPPGARITSEPAVLSSPPVAQEPPKGKKGLPFLKNPMTSLLSRRKTSQNIPDLTLPLRNKPEEPTYDPRIRGTRVHDFSAPRPRKTVVHPSIINEPATAVSSQASLHHVPPMPAGAPPVPPKDEHARSSRTSSAHSKGLSVEVAPSQKLQDPSGVQFVGIPVEQESTPRRKTSNAFSKASISRNASANSMKSSLSSIPRHMKSTSSRFSFDMIGAAKQEKLLEERHRQRQQDKMPDESTGRRDSRFDEFDEDAFDYDAMDYDDDFEERIPGVNADLEDEEDFGVVDDPDNDQENFAGFVFQRSNPESSLASPHSAGILPTPRDTNGQVIGYAKSGETPELEQIPGDSLDDLTEHITVKIRNEDTASGLGIQGLEPATEATESVASQLPMPQVDEKAHLNRDDELYFNDGLIHDFDGEGDGSAFDESIFDLNDTDQYGRPIPGLFANALAQRNAIVEPKKRESDITSRLSAQSGLSQSTAHTSLSVDTGSKPLNLQREAETCNAAQSQDIHRAISGAEDNTVAAYQAALAAAAHKAAASGKFRRNSSPPPSTNLTVTSPTTSGSSHSHLDVINDTIDYHEFNDDFETGLDDYELDDDAIIAEANASALANDSDGWYGQEFGFYSTPLPQTSHAPIPLGENNSYQYSHGGYFDPSGVNRTTSGRVVSREPNLTPITERSEYSNRNSLMSIGWPQGPNSNGTMQSPGFAQLAMMAEDHDMSLSALLKLRNKAWGGSQASLTSSREGSPYERNGTTSPWYQEPGGIGVASGRKNSAFSIYSQDSIGPGSDSGSPTLTMAISNVPTNSIPTLAMSSSPSSNTATSPVTAPIFRPLQASTTGLLISKDEEPSFQKATSKIAQPLNENMIPAVGIPSQQRPGMGHRHRGSADSISYIREEESGETRWILERRRTGESGEIEILEREVVGGGRI